MGVQEILFILVIALLVFGPKRLPELGRNLGKALTDFRRASMDLKTTVEGEIRKIEEAPARSIEPGDTKAGGG
ncbi:MAG: twin-arginine translocase TatA/TatE family subunit [Acidobacteria bacterium]|nr:twin-arginine translocase TatA/TatE family subunit [Acidobacteriota bacterium]